MNVRTRNQGGSLVTFALVGVVLAIVLVGGLYGLQRYRDSLTEPSEIASNSKSNDDKNTSDNSNGDTDKSTEQSSSSSNTSKSETDSSDKNTTSSSSSSSDSAANNLPATGPVNTLERLIAVSALTFAGVAFVRSRRPSLDF